MILIFDLDDTLYPEISYVKSGFEEVSKHLSANYALSESETNSCLLKILRAEGRGKIFDKFLKFKKIYTKKNVNECISVYRNHSPKINLYSDAKECITRFKKYKKYIITDGNIRVQRKKIEALGIRNQFTKVIPTYQYGISHSKPSLLCFNKIMQYENCMPTEMIYIGDNQNKDFINIKKIGMRTARILRGSFKNIYIDENHEAEFKFKNLNGITKTLIRNLYEDR